MEGGFAHGKLCNVINGNDRIQHPWPQRGGIIPLFFFSQKVHWDKTLFNILYKQATNQMNRRTRKFFGMILLVSWIVIYAAIGMTLGAAVVASAPGWVQIIFFLITGTLWIVPAGLIIRWMEK